MGCIAVFIPNFSWARAKFKYASDLICGLSNSSEIPSWWCPYSNASRNLPQSIWAANDHYLTWCVDRRRKKIETIKAQLSNWNKRACKKDKGGTRLRRNLVTIFLMKLWENSPIFLIIRHTLSLYKYAGKEQSKKLIYLDRDSSKEWTYPLVCYTIAMHSAMFWPLP